MAPTYTPLQDGYYSCELTSPNQCIYEPGLLVTGISSVLEPDDVELFAVYPNPATARARLLVRLKHAGPVSWALLDGSGRLLQQRQFSGPYLDEEMTLGGLAPALYYVRLVTPKGVALRPLRVVE